MADIYDSRKEYNKMHNGKSITNIKTKHKNPLFTDCNLSDKHSDDWKNINKMIPGSVENRAYNTKLQNYIHKQIYDLEYKFVYPPNLPEDIKYQESLSFITPVHINIEVDRSTKLLINGQTYSVKHKMNYDNAITQLVIIADDPETKITITVHPDDNPQIEVYSMHSVEIEESTLKQLRKDQTTRDLSRLKKSNCAKAKGCARSDKFITRHAHNYDDDI